MGEPASGSRGRVPGAGVRARVCVRGRGGAPGRAAATAAALGLGGHRPPAPASRPRPASRLSSRAAPGLGAQRRRLPQTELSKPREPSGAHCLQSRRRCGAAPRPLQSRPRRPREGVEPLAARMGSLGALALCLLRLLLLGLQRPPLPGARAQSAAGECARGFHGPRALPRSLRGESWVRWSGDARAGWPESCPRLRTSLLRPGVPSLALGPPWPPNRLTF